MATIAEILESRPYPGRGCLAARTTNGALCFAYFLTGRSPASRSRRLAVLEDGDISVQDTSENGSHDALRHYVAGARRADWVVIGNGSQVVPIAESLADGVDTIQTWRQHTFEPDPPIFTPRIWLAIQVGTDDPNCVVGFARRSERSDGEPDRVIWSVGGLAAGSGVLMTTYDGTAAEVRATQVPRDVHTTSATVDDVLAEVWTSLDSSLRVAAFALDPAQVQASLRIVH